MATKCELAESGADNVFDKFWTKFNEHELDNLKTDIKTLCCERPFSLVALHIESCDAGYEIGIPFSEAHCFTKQYTETLWPFGGIFLTGYSILRDFVKDKTVPEDSVKQMVLARLLNFLCDADSGKVLAKAGTFPTERTLAVFLADHLFSKLSYSSSYVLNKKMPGKDKTCPCGCGSNVSEHFGNTTIGHASTWHGNLDILLGRMDLCASITSSSDDPHIPRERGRVEVKKYYGIMEEFSSMSQTIAQTIVFSFYQKLRHKENTDCLVPCIGASGKEVIFFFYDSQRDVLLQSKSIPFTGAGKQISYIAIIAIWMVTNYKCLCTGLTEEMLRKSGKAGFFDQAGNSLKYLEEELSLGENIGCFTQVPFDPFVTRGEFEWLENYPPNDL